MNQPDAETAAARAQAQRELELAEKQFEQSLEGQRFAQKLTSGGPKFFLVILVLLMPFIGFTCGSGFGLLVFGHGGDYNILPGFAAIVGGVVGIMISFVGIIALLVQRNGKS